jgi:hypothetical protein
MPVTKNEEPEQTMNRMNRLVTCAALVALTGCNPSTPPRGEKPPETPATGAVIELPKDTAVLTLNKELNKETASVPAPVVAAADKTDFITSTEQKLKELDAKIDELVKKSEDNKDEAKAQAELALAALRDQRAKLTEKFDDLKKSSAEAWKELKMGFEAAVNELERAYENAKSKFS